MFRDVFADIGDEQSIAQSLSTFSGHLRSIIRIVEQAGPGTLVLLDELGAGTDPTEGSALAQALLDHFIRAGALVAATTHYAELKVYAHETPAARNAAVEFDLETLSPTYRLTIGLPGGSQAFAIAERLGLPDAIVADARSRLTENQRAFEATLASIRRPGGRDRTRRWIGRGPRRLRAAEALRTAEEERRRARRERDEAVRAARDEGERLVDRPPGRGRAAMRRRLERETVTAPAIDASLARAERRSAGCPAPSSGRGRRRRPPPARRRGRGSSATGRAAGTAAGRAGSPRSRRAAPARRSRRAACGSRSPSTTSSRRSAARARPGTAATAERRRAARPGVAAASGGARRRASAALQLEPGADRGVVAGPARRPGRRGARGAGALPRRRLARRASSRSSIIHGLGTGALRDAVREQAGGASAGQDLPSRRAGRGRRRRDDRHALGVAARPRPGLRRLRRLRRRRCRVAAVVVGRAGHREAVDRDARGGLGGGANGHTSDGGEPAAPGPAERVEPAAVEVRGPGALRSAPGTGAARGTGLPARSALLPAS